MTDQGDIILEAKGISKEFPGVKALDKVSVTLRRGRLTALLGENGAGKSTLMNIVAGVFPPDAGEVKLAGEMVHFANPREAQEAGIAMIFQELNLIADLTVAENIFLGREPLNGLGLIDSRAMNQQAAVLLERLDLAVEPTAPLGSLRVGQQQIVEIAKAISVGARVLIMDEPTSAITEHEIEALFSLIDSLKSQGVAIAYITHKFEELARIADDAVVMRDGRLIGASTIEELTYEAMVEMMVGREMKQRSAETRSRAGEEVLRLEKVSLNHPERSGYYLLRDISFEVRRGEAIGVFGLMGAGRTELLETIFGLHPRGAAGEIYMDGERVRIHSPVDAIEHGLALAPEDRKKEGLILGMSVAENASLPSLSVCNASAFSTKAPRTGWLKNRSSAFASRPPHRSRSSAISAEAINRKSFSGNGSPPIRECFCWTSLPVGSTWAPKGRFTRSLTNSGPMVLPSSSFRPSCRRFWRFPIASSFFVKGERPRFSTAKTPMRNPS